MSKTVILLDNQNFDIFILYCHNTSILLSKQKFYQQTMKIIGLTGSMCSGKSTIARFFWELDYIIVSADCLAKLILKEPSIIQAIKQNFGTEVLEQGQVCFAKLATQSFASKENIARLNSIMHPRISQRFATELAKAKQNNPQASVIYDAPLLFESNAYQAVDKIILVVTAYEVIAQRWRQKISQKNTHFKESDLKTRIKYQIPQHKAQKMADFIIDGNQELPQVKKQVFKIHQQISKGS